MLISPKGGKWWRFKYLFDDKEKLLSLGIYPDVSLKQARDRRDEARKQVAAGIDPGENRKAKKAAKVAKQANSFEVIAREWYAKHSPNWSANHGDRIIRRLKRDIFPWIGGLPVADITAPQLLEVIRRVERRGALGTAHLPEWRKMMQQWADYLDQLKAGAALAAPCCLWKALKSSLDL